MTIYLRPKSIGVYLVPDQLSTSQPIRRHPAAVSGHGLQVVGSAVLRWSHSTARVCSHASAPVHATIRVAEFVSCPPKGAPLLAACLRAAATPASLATSWHPWHQHSVRTPLDVRRRPSVSRQRRRYSQMTDTRTARQPPAAPTGPPNRSESV